MELFFISEEGFLIQINKYDFLDEDVYITDDGNTIYIWYGLKSSHIKKEAALRHARKLVMERVGSAKILLMNQNDEYGAFLAMLENLKVGIDINGSFITRPELDLEEIVKGPKKEYGLESFIRVAAYYLSQEHLSYDKLCWMLAEKQLIIEKSQLDLDEDEVRKKAEEIYKSSVTYDELCWIIAEFDVLIDRKYI